MTHDPIVLRALSTGAITDLNTNAARALGIIASNDPRAAEQFASRARTPLERATLCLSVHSPGVSLASYRAMARKMGTKDPDAQLIAMYGV